MRLAQIFVVGVAGLSLLGCGSAKQRTCEEAGGTCIPQQSCTGIVVPSEQLSCGPGEGGFVYNICCLPPDAGVD